MWVAVGFAPHMPLQQQFGYLYGDPAGNLVTGLSEVQQRLITKNEGEIQCTLEDFVKSDFQDESCREFELRRGGKTKYEFLVKNKRLLMQVTSGEVCFTAEYFEYTEELSRFNLYQPCKKFQTECGKYKICQECYEKRLVEKNPYPACKKCNDNCIARNNGNDAKFWLIPVKEEGNDAKLTIYVNSQHLQIIVHELNAQQF